MNTTVKIWCLPGLLVAGMWLATGCASQPTSRSTEPNLPTGPVQAVLEDGVTTAEVVRTAEDVLTRMHFAIEKLDADQGIVKTRPLRGAQFFEFWRSDNANATDCAQASLQSIRRTVELRVKTKEDQGVEASVSPPAGSIECHVSVQRLSLPENEVSSVSGAYGIHSRNAPNLLRFDLTPRQRRDMAWIDLGEDRGLAARIVARIEERLNR